MVDIILFLFSITSTSCGMLARELYRTNKTIIPLKQDKNCLALKSF